MKALPTSRSQLTTSFNPYNLPKGEVEDVGVAPSKENLVDVAIRIDNYYVISTELIPITPKPGQEYRASGFAGWSIRKMPRGKGKDDMFLVKKDGTKAKPFNFSGKLDTLNELHKALKKVHMSAIRTTSDLPNDEEMEALPKDENGIIDISDFMENRYTAKVFRYCVKCMGKKC